MSELPKHKFWGAGELDCPPELKAPNGELHTMLCKVCGDGWRKSGSVCLPLDPARVALAELVALKDIKERAAASHFAGPSGPLGEGWEAEWKLLQQQYIERQPKAWAAARAVLGQVGSTTTTALSAQPTGKTTDADGVRVASIHPQSQKGTDDA